MAVLTHEELKARLAAEHADGIELFDATAPCWRESAPHRPDVRSALITSDLLVRDDGSFVILHEHPSDTARVVSRYHAAGAYRLVPWVAYVVDLYCSIQRRRGKPAWLSGLWVFTHPVSRRDLLGRRLSPDDVLAEGDVHDRDDDWASTSLMGLIGMAVRDVQHSFAKAGQYVRPVIAAKAGQADPGQDTMSP